MIYLKIFAGGGGKTLSVCTNTAFKLFVARGITEIGSRPANVVEIALEIGHFGNGLCLGDYRLMTANADVPPLVIRKRAEVTGTVAAAVMDDGKLNLLDPGDPAKCLIRRMIGTHKGERVGRVHFLGGKGG